MVLRTPPYENLGTQSALADLGNGGIMPECDGSESDDHNMLDQGIGGTKCFSEIQYWIYTMQQPRVVPP